MDMAMSEILEVRPKRKERNKRELRIQVQLALRTFGPLKNNQPEETASRLDILDILAPHFPPVFPRKAFLTTRVLVSSACFIQKFAGEVRVCRVALRSPVFCLLSSLNS